MEFKDLGLGVCVYRAQILSDIKSNQRRTGTKLQIVLGIQKEINREWMREEKRQREREREGRGGGGGKDSEKK